MKNCESADKQTGKGLILSYIYLRNETKLRSFPYFLTYRGKRCEDPGRTTFEHGNHHLQMERNLEHSVHSPGRNPTAYQNLF